MRNPLRIPEGVEISRERLRRLSLYLKLAQTRAAWKGSLRPQREMERLVETRMREILRPLFLKAAAPYKNGTSSETRAVITATSVLSPEYSVPLRLLAREQAVLAAQYGKNRIIREIQRLPGPESKGVVHGPLPRNLRNLSEQRGEDAARRLMDRVYAGIVAVSTRRGSDEASLAGIVRLERAVARDFGRDVANTSRSEAEYETALAMDRKLTWNNQGDDRVRASHADLQGKTVDAGEDFGNGCRYPRDPEGPGDETQGCRCYLTVAS